MQVIQLKFLLALLKISSEDRIPITKIKLNSKTPASQRDKIGRDLQKQELVACSEDITKIEITSAGKALLKANTETLPLTAPEFKIIKACEKGVISPSQTKVTPAKKRQELIEGLLERGLIQAAQTKLKEVSLTERGKNALLYDYQPSGSSSISLTQDLLGVYLRFLRKHLSTDINYQFSQQIDLSSSPSDDEILEMIIHLDKELRTSNYLPIFHLRHKLQPPLSREELDEALYRLGRNDKIEMSTLAEVSQYSREEILAGIEQDVGGPLFFIIVL